MIANNNIYLKIPQISLVLYIYTHTHWPTRQKFIHHHVIVAFLRCPLLCVGGPGIVFGQPQATAEFCQLLASLLHCNCFPKALSQGQRDQEFPIFPLPDCQISSHKLSFIPGLVTGETAILFRGKPLKPLTLGKFCSLGPQKMRENPFILACLPLSDPFFLIQDFQSDRCPINMKGST